MFSKMALLSQVKTVATRITFVVGCVAVLALQSPGIARGQDGDLRTELLRALELQSAVAESLGRSDLAASLDEAIEKVLFVSDAELAPLADVVDEIQNYSGALQRLDAAVQEAVTAGETQSVGTTSVIPSGPVPPPSLTPPPYFDGGSLGLLCRIPDATIGMRVDTEVMLTAQIALGAVKTLWAGVEVACGLDVVNVGSLGIGFVACAALAVSVDAAEETVAAFERCDATVDEAHLDAAFLRAEDNFNLGVVVHDDLAIHNANLSAHNANIDGDLAAHDAQIKALLAALQSSVDENQQKLDRIIELLLTPQGRREGFPLN